MISTKQQFIHFLKDNNAYEEFMYNFLHNKIRKMDFIQYINNTAKYNFFYNAFPWHLTKGGIQKWRTLSRMWIEKIQVPQQFIQFLKENNVYEQYLKLIIERNKKDDIKTKLTSIEDLFYNYHPMNYIYTCILSIYNKQELEKWQTIDEQWQLLLKTKPTTT